MRKYQVILSYKSGLVIPSGSSQCRISSISPISATYGFQGRNATVRPWEDFKFDKPLLLLREIRDADRKTTHLYIEIKEWNGFDSASIMLGDFLIWSSDQLKPGPLRNSVHMNKVFALSLVKNPLLGLEEKREFVSAHTL